MPESSDVADLDQGTPEQYNALRDDALRLLLAQGIGESAIAIAAGVLTLPDDSTGIIYVAAQSGTEDDLDTMIGTGIDAGDMIVLIADAGDTITVKDSAAANGFSLGGYDVVIEEETCLCVVKDGTTWKAMFNFKTAISQWNQFIDGGRGVVTTGIKGPPWRIPWNCYILRSTLYADQSGSAVLDLWTDTHANYMATVAGTITASAKPTLSSAIKAEDTTLTGWTRELIKDSHLVHNVDSCSTCEWLYHELLLLRRA